MGIEPTSERWGIQNENRKLTKNVCVVHSAVHNSDV
jgi:hypothetical protein